MAAPCDRLIIRSDWDFSLKDLDGRAWLTFKTATPPSVYSELISHGRSTDGLPYLSTKDSTFSVSNITKRSLVISYNGENASLSRKFIAPTLTYSAIHSIKKQVTCLDVTSGGLGVSCDSEGKLKVWETSSGEVRRTLEGHVGDVYTCRFFPSNRVILSAGADTMIKIWSAETGACATTITGHKAAISDSVIVDRGRNIVTTSRDGTAKLWDVGNQACLATFTDIGGEVNACAIGVPENSVDLGPAGVDVSDREVATEGKMLLLACEDGSVSGHGLQSREQIFALQLDSAVNSCTFLSQSHAVCGTQNGLIHLIDLRNTNSALMSWKESRGPILSLLPHKGGFFASTGDGSCFHVNESWQTMAELTGSDCDPVYRLACDGTNVYSSCRDGSIRRYSLSFV